MGGEVPALSRFQDVSQGFISSLFTRTCFFQTKNITITPMTMKMTTIQVKLLKSPGSNSQSSPNQVQHEVPRQSSLLNLNSLDLTCENLWRVLSDIEQTNFLTLFQIAAVISTSLTGAEGAVSKPLPSAMAESGVTLMANQSVPEPGQAIRAPLGGGVALVLILHSILLQLLQYLTALLKMQQHPTISKGSLLDQIIINNLNKSFA